MIENNLLKTNFIGKDGFRWWIGQVPPSEDQQDQVSQLGEAWGARAKVRILGYHPLDEQELPNKDLPWAQILLSTQGGSGGGGMGKSNRVRQGDTVLGFFLDGDDAQLPVIIGIFARNGQRFGGDGKYTSPFVPFSGYNDHVKSGNILIKNEDGGMTGKKNLKSPRFLTKQLTDKLNDQSFDKIKEFLSSKETQKGIQEGLSQASSAFEEGFSKIQEELPGALDKISEDLSSIDVPFDKIFGEVISFAGSADTEKINVAAKNLNIKMNKLGNGIDTKEMFKIKSDLTKKILPYAKNISGQLMNTAMEGIVPVANANGKKKWTETFNTVLAATKNTSIASKAATAMQRSFLKPLKKVQDDIPCVGKNIAESLGGDISDLLTPLMDNVENFVPCVADQFTGALFNKIIGGIEKGMAPALGGISKLLGGFDAIGDLRSKASGLLGVAEVVGCFIPEDPKDETNFWEIGKGATNVAGVSAESILKVANIAQEAQEALGSPQGLIGSLISDVGAFDFMNTNVSTEGFSSVLGECYTGPPLNCTGIKINVFGGDGSGVKALPIIGAIVGQGQAEQVGSLIGVKIDDPGGGYTVPPIVEVTDTCNNGYGAVARSVIDYDPSSPTYQQVTDIIVVSPGENYPVTEENTNEEYTVDHVVVVSSGENYRETDTITDNEGNVYTKILDERGRILNVIPPNPSITNVVPVTSLPELTIETRTGLGAYIKAQIAPRPEYQGEIKQVIDCITPRDGIVGYINGDPYYGPFHVHPDTGVKMVGAAHTTAPHAIIYDTPAQSRTSRSVSMTSVAPNIISSPASTYTPTPAPTQTASQSPEPPSSTPPPSTPPSTPPPSTPPSSPPSSGGGGYGY